MNFDQYIANANEFVDEVARELEIADAERAGRILRSVLWTLRQRLTPQESFDLIAQLPIMIKGIYVDGWKFSKSPDKGIKTASDFLSTVAEWDRLAMARDFPNDVQLEKSTQAVFRVLKRRVSAGQLADVEGTLPKQIRQLWADA